MPSGIGKRHTNQDKDGVHAVPSLFQKSTLHINLHLNIKKFINLNGFTIFQISKNSLLKIYFCLISLFQFKIGNIFISKNWKCCVDRISFVNRSKGFCQNCLHSQRFETINRLLT